MTANRYQVPKGRHEGELEVKRSRFICHLQHTPSSLAAKDFVAEIKAQYADATHNCWAYQAGPTGDSRQIGCSDDGEPHGTAGRPMLTVLSHADVGEITAVVTRYYGGTKLGTGGLARAYADAVKLALETLPTREKINFEQFSLQINYDIWPQVELLLNQLQAENIKTQFTDSIVVEYQLDESKVEEFSERVRDLSHGKAKPEKLS